MSEQTNYTARQFAEKIGVHIKTVQRWDRQGVFKARRTPTNQRFYTHNDYLAYLKGEAHETVQENQDQSE
jgi:DNA-binding transcriptional MerR regulator